LSSHLGLEKAFQNNFVLSPCQHVSLTKYSKHFTTQMYLSRSSTKGLYKVPIPSNVTARLSTQSQNMSPQSPFSSTASPTNLYITTIILYTLLILPSFYIWRRHGRPGFLAYNFVYAFCAIRITGAALSIVAVHDASLATAAAIVNSVAISPLLLAALGVLHEARNARIADVESRREWMSVGGLHGVVTTGMVLVIIGIINVVEGVSTTANSGLIKAGLTVLVLAYVVLLIWTTISLRQPIRRRDETFPDGTLVSSPFLIEVSNR
jgi:hypothetical protein